jgi:hypothetical protein
MELEVSWNTPGNDRQPGAWSLRLRVINGELQSTDDVFPFEAPMSGYQAEWVGGGIDSPASSLTSFDKTFYIVDTQRRQFGRMSIFLHPYFRDKNKFEVTYWINPNGERGLLNDTESGN